MIKNDFTPQEKGKHVLLDVINAMERVEIRDRRVNKIKIPYEEYYTLLSLPEIHYVLSMNVSNGSPLHSASLYGAELIPNRTEFEAINDDLPGNSYTAQIHQGSWIVRKIRGNLTIVVRSRACPIREARPNEYKAIETLREMISETEFRKYIVHGFVLVEGKSGAVYQIFRNQSHTRVWRNGKVQEEICVRLADHRCPPTDNVIAFKTLIEVDEEAFKKCGNVYRMAA